MKHKLPVLMDRALASTKADRVQVGTEFERQLRQTSDDVSCSVGCSNCCHHPFMITIVEGLLLYRWLASHGLWTASLRKRVVETRDKTLGLSIGVWLLSNMPCPLLEDRKCTAYDARPLHCRTTFSVGDPALCHPHELAFGKGLVPNLEVVLTFNKNVQGAVKPFGMQGVLMPLAEAVLLGEEVETGRLDITETDRQYAKDVIRD